MMGFSLLIMLFILGLPVFLIVTILVAVIALKGQRNWLVIRQQTPNSLVAQDARHCAHCGQGLQADWTHCPKCGAPISE